MINFYGTIKPDTQRLLIATRTFYATQLFKASQKSVTYTMLNH